MMNVFRVVLTTFLFCVVTVLVQAQAPLLNNGTSTTAPPQVTPGKNLFAVIDSAAFTDEKAGIARVIAAMKQVEARFEPIRKEINTMRGQLNTIQADIEKKQGTAPQTELSRLADQGAQLEVQLKRKAEDAEADYPKQLNAALEPLQTDIKNSLNTYAQSRGILMIIDSNRVPVVYAHATIDITKDFIAEYNRTHPVGAAPAAAPVRP
jgi:Skp family chaperone for outer membrane proteins